LPNESNGLFLYKKMELIIAISITSLMWIILILLFYIKSKRLLNNVRHEYMKQALKANESFNEKLEKLLHAKQIEIQESYDKGVSDTLSKNDLYVQVTPWKEEIESASFFKNKKSMKVGYKYQLFSGGMPCFDPYIIILEELNIDKLNEEKINRVFDNIEMIILNIPKKGNIPVKVIANFKTVAKNLFNTLIDKKKNKPDNVDNKLNT